VSARARALTALSLAAAASCTKIADPCFEPGSVVRDLRVLSVRVDPPEAEVDLDAGSVPPLEIRATVGSSRTSLGDATQAGTSVEVRDAAVAARLCLEPANPKPSDLPGCPDGPSVAKMGIVPMEGHPLIVLPPVELLRAALQQDPLRGLAGIRLRLHLDFVTADQVVSATRTLLFHQKGSATSVNHALELAGVVLIDGQGQRTTYSPGQSLDLIVAQSFGVRPLIAPGAGAEAAIEDYEGLDATGNLVPLREHVTYKFYAANSLFIGRPDFTYSQNNAMAVFDGLPGDQANEPEPGDPEPPNGLVSILPVFPGNQAGAFWIVARDGRGAEASLLVPYNATELRDPCLLPADAGPARKGCMTILFGCQ
jgi:hypothetical protein